MRFGSFRYCMMISATALGAVSAYYFVKYAFLNVALNTVRNSSSVKGTRARGSFCTWLRLLRRIRSNADGSPT